MKTYKIVVAEDQALTRKYFEQMIDSTQEFEIVASFEEASLVEVFCLRNEVDIIVMDVMMQNGISGLEAAERIKRHQPELKIIIATSMPEFSWIEMAKSLGVEGFWYKDYSQESILEVLRIVAQGGSFYPSKSPTVNFGKITSADLTKRELEVLKEMTGGYQNAEIAEHLYISVDTVKKHIKSMLDKTGFRNRTELAVEARSSGITIL